MKFRCFQVEFRRNLENIQMFLDRIQTEFRRNLDIIQKKFRGFQIKFRLNLDEIQLFLEYFRIFQKKFRRNLEEIQKEIRRNLEEIRTDIEKKLDKIQMYGKKISHFQIIIRQNLGIIQMNLDIGCPKKLDKIQTKFRHPIKNLDKFSMCSKFF